MRLPPSLLGLLSVGSIALAACGADTGADDETASGETALTNQAEADAGAAATPDSGQEQGPGLVLPTPTDPCPGCGLG